MKRFAILAALCLLALPAAALAGDMNLSVSPSEITIDATYDGAILHVAGEAPEGSQIVARFSGAPEKVAVKEKGKALGVLWMNMNTLHFSGVPSVFLVESSAPLEGLGKAGCDLGLAGLMRSVTVEPATADAVAMRSELLKLKRKDTLYRESVGGVTLEPAQNGVQKFSATIAVPSRLSAGAYTVDVFAVKDGVVAAQASRPLQAKMVGIPALMADLAFNSAVWYGVLASFIAIVAGLAIGLVFQSKGAH